MLTETELHSLVDKIVQCMQPDKVIIFGSYAKGTASHKSDLDILIVKDTHLPMINRNNKVKSLVNNLIIPVDIHVYTPEEVEVYGSEEYSFIHSVLKTGKVMYQKGLSPLTDSY